MGTFEFIELSVRSILRLVQITPPLRISVVCALRKLLALLLVSIGERECRFLVGVLKRQR